ncbi:MAG TPA: DNA gyrase inhibitor YacG [Bryobacteraceae bacterium]|nr:DNA gyrase inhibitor YacG [Bryobacteraceae bacterium]
MKCPICKKEIGAGAPFAPFCSDRCRLIDLANWADGKYVISSPAAAEDDEDPIKIEPVDED